VSDGIAVLDVSRLPDAGARGHAPVWWGMVMLLVIETAVFGMLIVSYYYLKLGEPQWPPPGIPQPDLLLPSINTIVLLASSVSMHAADHAASEDDQPALRWGLLISLVLAITFLVLKVVEYSGVSYRWDDHAYGSIVWTIIGFHSTHVLTLVLKTMVVGTLAWRGYFAHRRKLIGIQVNGLYWHFVVGVWVPLYLVLYWSPRLME
jgi:heme/copper-type cytochrome/quinol oxidase subunit 3